MKLSSPLFFLCLATALLMTGVAQEWRLRTTPTNITLQSLSFVDSLTGWAAGDSGIIIHTSDGGRSWSIQNSNTPENIRDIFFLDHNYGWATAWSLSNPFGTLILSTTDGGVSWTVDPFAEENIFMNTVFFLDSLNGWMGGTPGGLFFSRDGGKHWTRAPVDSGGGAGMPVENFLFYDSLYGYANGGKIDLMGVVWRTVDGGQSWSPRALGPEPIRQLHIFDSLNVIGVGGDFEYGASVVHTTDGGESWNYRTLGIFGMALALSFRTEQEGWAPIGYARTFMRTTDAGETWQEIQTPQDAVILDLVFTDSLHGYAVGANGVFLTFDNLVGVALAGERPNRPEEPILLRNYPNPFNPSTNLSFRITESGLVELAVYDLLGRRIRTLVNKTLLPGRYQVVWDGRNEFGEAVPSGAYWYRLNTGGFVQTRQMLLVR